MTVRLVVAVFEFPRQNFDRYIALETEGCQDSGSIHESTKGTTLFGHGQENLTRTSIFVKPDRDVTFMPGDTERRLLAHATVTGASREAQ